MKIINLEYDLDETHYPLSNSVTSQEYQFNDNSSVLHLVSLIKQVLPLPSKWASPLISSESTR